jgi:hypothetical protein
MAGQHHSGIRGAPAPCDDVLPLKALFRTGRISHNPLPPSPVEIIGLERKQYCELQVQGKISWQNGWQPGERQLRITVVTSPLSSLTLG